MANKSKSATISDRLYNLNLGRDYTQPTSLESDLDYLADGIIEILIPKGTFKAPTKEGYLRAALMAINDPKGKLTQAIKLCGSIDEILGSADYGVIDEADSEKLESYVEELIGELEDPISELEENLDDAD